MKVVAILLLICSGAPAFAQDTLTASYINSVVQKTEERLQMLVMEKKDTVIYDNPDSPGKSPALHIHTEYYTNLQTKHIEKIMERSTYNRMTTEITVYYQLGMPIRFTSTQWDGAKVKIDFDIFYMNDNSVHFVKRCQNKGKPDVDEFLRWSYELLRSHQPPTVAPQMTRKVRNRE